MSALMSFRIERFHSRAAARQLNKKKKKGKSSTKCFTCPTKRGEERDWRVREMKERSLRIVSFDGHNPRSRRRSAIRERAR